MSASLYYADPDGNQMEFSVDCFADKADCTAYFKGEAIGQNPVGVEYARRLAGAAPRWCERSGTAANKPSRPRLADQGRIGTNNLMSAANADKLTLD